MIRHRWLCFPLLLVAAWVFWPGLSGGFLFDDFPNLVRAEGWKIASLAPTELWRALHSDISGSIGRPFSMLSFAINHALTGLDPWWLKFTNLLWHLGNGLLLGLLLREIFSALPISTRPSRYAVWALVALWLLHPLQTSAVLYIVQRMEIAAASGILLSLLFYVRFRNQQISGRTRLGWLFAAGLAWVAGLGFKETALLAPVFALLIELIIFRFNTGNTRAAGNLQTSSSPLLKQIWLLICIFGFLAYLLMVIPKLQHWPYASRGWSPLERVLTQGPVLARYLQQILIPLPETYVFYYDNVPVSHSLINPPWTAFSFLLFFMLATLGFGLRHRAPLVTLGIGWFFVAHALTSNLWPLELAFEHRNYLAIAGVWIALVPAAQWIGRKLHADARAVLALLPILLLATLTHVQAKSWGQPTQLAWTLENRNPTSVRASYGLGEQLLELSKNSPDNPTWAMALKQFERASELSNDSALPIQAQLLMLGQAHQSIPPELWTRFRDALRSGGLRSEHIGALHAISQCSIQNRCLFDKNQLLHVFWETLEAYPNHQTLLTLYANFAWNGLGDRELAIRLQRDAASINPDNLAMKIALAKFLLAYGREAEFAEGKALLDQLHLTNSSGLLDDELDDLEQLAKHLPASEISQD